MAKTKKSPNETLESPAAIPTEERLKEGIKKRQDKVKDVLQIQNQKNQLHDETIVISNVHPNRKVIFNDVQFLDEFPEKNRLLEQL